MFRKVAATVNTDQDLEMELKHVNCINCTDCKYCSIVPYDAPDSENFISDRDMAKMDGFVKGVLICEKNPADVKTQTESNLSRIICHHGEVSDRPACHKCRYGKKVIVQLSNRKIIEKQQLSRKDAAIIKKHCISREVYICKNRNIDERLNNRYLSKYIYCDKFKQKG